MKTIRIKDNSTINKDDLSTAANIVKKIADKSFEQLEREGMLIFPPTVKDSPDLTGEQTVIQSVNNTYRTSNVMGFIGLGDERIIIASRFCSGDNDYFLQYLLSKVLNFNIIDLETDAEQNDRLLSLLIFLFPYYLKTAVRKGLFKTYIRYAYNDGNPKGTIDIARHIKENTPFIGNIAYNQRENSYDNDLTELIRHTIEFIKKKPYGHTLLARVKDEASQIVNATAAYEPHDRQRIIEKNKKHVLRHAYYNEYRALQHLCIMILQQQRHQVGYGSRQIYGILFDGAWLWEEYINTLVKDSFYHPMNKSGGGAQRLFSANTGLIYPDFISRNTSPRTIADAKYKPIENIGNKDYLQVLAYMFRFDAKTGYYFYPKTDNKDDARLCLNQGSTYEQNVTPRNDVYVIKYGLKIPTDADSYSRFVSKIQQSEAEFKRPFLCP